MPTPSSAPDLPARPTGSRPVPLRDVAADLSIRPPEGAGHLEVTGVSQASSSVRPGDLYAALPGARTHGARYAAAARDAGAVAVLTDPDGESESMRTGLPVLVVPAPRPVLGSVAALVYGHPARDLTLIGVTGTSGKTTTTHLLSAALAGAGLRTAVVGTVGTLIDGRPVASSLTTPEAPDLHALFAVMREAGVQACAMEVSSHALVMGRVDGVVFDLAVFTNFGRDHLDFHADLEEYFAAKADLFTAARARRGLVNADDPAVARLAAAPAIPTTTFGRDAAADWRAVDVTATDSGSRFGVRGAGAAVDAQVRLPGAFNVSNALAALAAAGECGADLSAAAAGLAAVGAVPGRMERVEEGQPFTVVVDYAHKPDALAATLQALRPVTTGRLLVVLGAGGNRDQGKRRVMGEQAAKLADVVVVTDDNPRTEDPASIRAELLAGARSAGTSAELADVGDREQAIAHALGIARTGDTVLVAGKGHETGQEVAGEVLPFDDREVARRLLRARVSGGAA